MVTLVMAAQHAHEPEPADHGIGRLVIRQMAPLVEQVEGDPGRVEQQPGVAGGEVHDQKTRGGN